MKKKAVFFSFCLIMAMFICGAVHAYAEWEATYDVDTMTATYTNTNVTIPNNGTAYFALYRQNRLVGISAEDVTSGESSISLSAEVQGEPDYGKVFLFDSALKPMSDVLILDKEKDFVTIQDSVATKTVTENIADYDETTGVFQYHANIDDTESRKIYVDPENLTVYYNGSQLLDQDTVNTFGGLKNLLVDNADIITFQGRPHEKFDTIYVTDYSYRQVVAVNEADNYVKFTSGGMSLDPGDRDEFSYNLYDADGNEISLADVKMGDIFNIVAPIYQGIRDDFDNVPYMDIYVSRKTISGMVDEEVYSNNTCKIDGEIFRLDPHAVINTGEISIFYITIDGKIYSSDLVSNVEKGFAFLVDYSVNNSLTNYHLLKLFEENGELQIYQAAATVKVYEEQQDPETGEWEYTSQVYKRADGTLDAFFERIAELVADEPSEESAFEKLGNRLVRFKINLSGEITELWLPGAFEHHISDFAVFGNNNAEFHFEEYSFGGRPLDMYSKLFITPISEVEEDAFNAYEEDIQLGSFSNLNEDRLYNSYLYTLEEDSALGAAVISDPEGIEPEPVDMSEHLAVVKTRATGVDADGKDVDKYTYIQSGETITKTVDYNAQDTVQTMNTGDVFRYALNEEDEITGTQLIYVSETETFDPGNYSYENYDSNQCAILYGEVTEARSDRMRIDDSLLFLFNKTGGNTYAFVDESERTDALSPDAVKLLEGPDDLKESYGINKFYVIAVIEEAERYEDCVQILRN